MERFDEKTGGKNLVVPVLSLFTFRAGRPLAPWCGGPVHPRQQETPSFLQVLVSYNIRRIRVESMPRRLQDVIWAGDNPTKY